MHRSEHEEAADHGRYVARIAGIDGQAEITFTRRGPRLISADRTGAPDITSGDRRGVSASRVQIADTRANGFKVIPICPYVKAQYRKHPNWAAVRNTSHVES